MSDVPSSGQVALVVGGASGLGRAVVHRFAAAGASIAVFDRHQAKLEQLARDVPGPILTFAGDVRTLADQQDCVERVVDSFGGIDALIFTVGVVDYIGSYRDYDIAAFGAAFDEVFAINTRGPVQFTLVAAESLRQRRGSVTFTLSTSAFFAPASGPVYGMSKAALVMAVRQLALDLAPEVRVNGVVPGAIFDTDIRGPAALGQEQTESRLKEIGAAETHGISRNPLRTAAKGDNYAGVYLFLAGPDAAVATGSIISWDTGSGLVGHAQVGRRSVITSAAVGGEAEGGMS